MPRLLTLNFLSVPSICTSCLPTTLARPSISSAPDLRTRQAQQDGIERPAGLHKLRGRRATVHAACVHAC